MAKQVLIQVRVEEDLKNEVTEIYEKLGLDLPTAIRIFLNKSKLDQGIPFSLTLQKEKVTTEEALHAFEQLRKQAADLPDMTLEDINSEIYQSRKDRKNI